MNKRIDKKVKIIFTLLNFLIKVGKLNLLYEMKMSTKSSFTLWTKRLNIIPKEFSFPKHALLI